MNRKHGMGGSRTGVRALAVAAVGCSSAMAMAECPEWAPLGAGLGSDVLALEVFEGELIAGGQFTTAGGEPAARVAAWDGESWRSLDSTIDETVRSMTVFDDRLVIGGGFVVAGGQAARSLAAWDGESWEQIGGGTNDTVFAVGTYDFGDGEELLIGGNFSSVGGATGIRLSFFGGFDGTWRNRGTVNGIVRAFGSYNGDLIIGGDFTTVNGQPRSHIARWDGDAWQPLGTGMDGSVFALAEYNGELIAGGRFETAGGVFTTQVAAWDGDSWRMLGGGLADGLIETWVWSLAVKGDDLIVGGEFTTADFEPAERVARWDGEAWHPLGEGTSHTVYALAVHNDDVVAAGQFAQAGGEPASRIARWVECPDCIADWNGDGEVDVNDFFAYLDDFEAGDPRADLNNDGEIDINDFFIFLSEFEAGC